MAGQSVPLPPDSSKVYGTEDAAKIALQTVHAAIVEEFAVTDRLEGKARSLVTVAGVVFAVAQAVAIPLLRDVLSNPAGINDLWKQAIVFCLCLSAAGMMVVILLATRVWSARKQQAISLDMVSDLVNKSEIQSMPARVAAVHLTGIARDRRANNQSRAKWLKAVAYLFLITMTAAIAEIVIAALSGLYA